MFFIKINKIVAIISLLTAGTATFAATGLLFDQSKVFEQAINEVSRDVIVRTFKSALKCDRPGEMFYETSPGSVYGTRCNENGMINVFNAGVGYRLIERFGNAGIPTEWVREQLADPANLRWVKDNMSGTIASLVEASATGEYADDNVFGDTGVDGGYATVFDQKGYTFTRHAKAFILRRISEAKPEDKVSIAEIWTQIIEEQFQIYSRNRKLLDDLKAEQEN